MDCECFRKVHKKRNTTLSNCSAMFETYSCRLNNYNGDCPGGDKIRNICPTPRVEDVSWNKPPLTEWPYTFLEEAAHFSAVE